MISINSLSFLSRLFAGMLIAMLLAVSARAADAEDAGPHFLIITYRAEARDRPAFRAYLSNEGRAPFDSLVARGGLKSYRILFNVVTTGTWDAAVVLAFERHVDSEKWTELERTSPGGLTRRGLALARPLTTIWADETWKGGDSAAVAASTASTASSATSAAGAMDMSRSGAIYYVIPYTYLTTYAEYKQYVDGYVVPQIDGWMREGIVGGYSIFMNRYSVGMPWDSLFVLQYKNLAALGGRESAIAKVRGVLRNDAEWRRLSDIKQKLRTESENTIAELLTR